jgi:PKD repeat protein
MKTLRNERLLPRVLALLLMTATVGCGLEGQGAPDLSGPSGLAHAFSLAASPTQLPRDGSSQSVVTVTATDVTGGPLAGQRYRLAVTPTEAAPTVAEVTTDANGRAVFTVTAPATSSSADSIAVTATALGGFSDTLSQFLTITLTGGAGAPVDPPTVESPTVQPDSPIADQPAVFTTSASAAAGHRIVQYSWNFGDGSTAQTTLPQVLKTYTIPGSYTVLVTVTDDVGGTAFAVATVDVTSATTSSPIARFTVVPSQPRAGEAAMFDGSSSTAGTRAVIIRYSWSFGDGTTEVTTTPTIGHTYDEARTYPVTLTVTDNLNQTSTVGQQIIVVP